MRARRGGTGLAVVAPSALPSWKPLHPGRRPGTGQQYTASRPPGTGARARPGYRLTAAATVERRTRRSPVGLRNCGHCNECRTIAEPVERIGKTAGRVQGG
jgi:hypothetical protein